MKEVEEELEKKVKEMEMRMDNVEKVMEGRIEELKKVIKDKDKKLEEERCEFEELEDMNSALLIKERQSNDEIQEARKELIRVCIVCVYLCFVGFSFRYTSLCLFIVHAGIERYIR